MCQNNPIIPIPIPIPIPNPPIIDLKHAFNTAWVDFQKGSDSAGKFENILYPFKTLQGAISFAKNNNIGNITVYINKHSNLEFNSMLDLTGIANLKVIFEPNQKINVNNVTLFKLMGTSFLDVINGFFIVQNPLVETVALKTVRLSNVKIKSSTSCLKFNHTVVEVTNCIFSALEETVIFMNTSGITSYLNKNSIYNTNFTAVQGTDYELFGDTLNLEPNIDVFLPTL